MGQLSLLADIGGDSGLIPDAYRNLRYLLFDIEDARTFFVRGPWLFHVGALIASAAISELAVLGAGRLWPVYGVHPLIHQVGEIGEID